MIPVCIIIEEQVSTVDVLACVLTLEDNNRVGMECIAEVIFNRAKRNPENIRSVLLRKWQFSCLNPHTVNGRDLSQLIEKAKNRSNWKDAIDISRLLLDNQPTNHIGNATHYHVYRGKYKVTPYWTHPSLGGSNKKVRIQATIGDHVFLTGVD